MIRFIIQLTIILNLLLVGMVTAKAQDELQRPQPRHRMEPSKDVKL
jgi:hypothetical protein